MSDLRKSRIKSLYIDNYKTFVNFKIDFDKFNFFIGNNGVGKSNLFSFLFRLSKFIDGKLIRNVFSNSYLTRWYKKNTLNCELVLENGHDIYNYSFIVGYDEETLNSTVIQEKLLFNNNFIMYAENGELQFYYDDFEKGPKINYDNEKSAFSFIVESKNNKKLMWFKNRLLNNIVIKLNPQQIDGKANSAENELNQTGEKFASWFQILNQENPEIIQELNNNLKNVFDTYKFFRFKRISEELKNLILVFNEKKNNEEIDYNFDELSEGQRSLFFYYTLLAYAKNRECSIFIDEPVNYIALSEIQPLMSEFYDVSHDNDLQISLISHHPEVINYLMPDVKTFLFEREDNYHTRYHVFNSDNEKDSNLLYSELVQRGWLKSG